VRLSADVGGSDLFWLQGAARGFPLADSLASFGPADVVIEVGERSVAQKLKLVFYSDRLMGKADAVASLDGLLYVGFSFSLFLLLKPCYC
jgi:hypothetical protein